VSILDETALAALIRDQVREVVREELRARQARPAAGDLDEYLSARTAARIAEVNEATVRRWVARGCCAGTGSAASCA
jgi:hypothetical protein